MPAMKVITLTEFHDLLDPNPGTKEGESLDSLQKRCGKVGTHVTCGGEMEQITTSAVHDGAIVCRNCYLRVSLPTIYFDFERLEAYLKPKVDKKLFERITGESERASSRASLPAS